MRCKSRAVSIVAIACSIAAPAFAQDATDSTTPSVDGDIVVTATKRSESVNKVPMSITAATGEQLQQLGVVSVAGLAKIVPGFVAQESSYGTPIYYIRGVGYAEKSLIAKSTVGIYIDEVPIPYPVMSAGATMDLERVEVLKGPQGTLFGSNATGGAINYIAAKPTPDFEARINASYGRFGAGTVGGFVSGPLSPELSARLSLNHEARGDWQKSATRPGDTLGARNFTQARAQLLWEPTSEFKAHLTVNGFLDRSDSQAGQFVGTFGQTAGVPIDPVLVAYPVASSAREADWDNRFPLKRNNKMIQTALRMDYQLTEGVALTSISSYSHFKQRQGQDTDGTALPVVDVQVSGKIDTFSQELRLAGDAGPLRWVIGANYEHSKAYENVLNDPSGNTSARNFAALGLPNIDLVTFYADTKFVSKAVFANLDYDIGDLITLHAGGRYTDTKLDFRGCLTSAGNNTLGIGLSTILGLPTPPVGSCVTIFLDNTGPSFGEANTSLPEDNVSWRFGIDVKPAAGQLIYANVSRGFKSGQITNLAGTSVGQYVPAVQEKLTAYEVGFKSSLLDRALQVNGALFYYDYRNKQLLGQVQVPVFDFLEALVNIPKSRVKGAELEVVARPVEGLRVSAAGVYVDSKITSAYSNFTLFGQLESFKGSAFPNTPKWQLNGDVSYKFGINDKVGGFVGSTITYRSTTSGDFKPNPIVAIDGYTLIDLRAGIEDPDGKWRASLYGRNVTNKYYWTLATRQADTLVRFAGMPATYGIDLTVNF